MLSLAIGTDPNESTDLQGNYSMYEEHYQHVHAIVHTNEQKYCNNEVDNVNFDENGLPEHLWSKIAPCTEAARAQALAEGSELLTNMSPEDNAELITITCAKVFES